jgi:hypothetical protein
MTALQRGALAWYLEHGLKWMYKQAYLNIMKTLKKFQSKFNTDLKQKISKIVKLHSPIKPTFLEDTTPVHSH